VTIATLKQSGKTPSESDRLNSLVMRGTNESTQDVSIRVGIKSRAQEESVEESMSLRTSSLDVGVNSESRGGCFEEQ